MKLRSKWLGDHPTPPQDASDYEMRRGAAHSKKSDHPPSPSASAPSAKQAPSNLHHASEPSASSSTGPLDEHAANAVVGGGHHTPEKFRRRQLLYYDPVSKPVPHSVADKYTYDMSHGVLIIQAVSDSESSSGHVPPVPLVAAAGAAASAENENESDATTGQALVVAVSGGSAAASSQTRRWATVDEALASSVFPVRSFEEFVRDFNTVRPQ
jgi:hypothetical protein